MSLRVDAHQHFWNLAKVEYPWLTPEAVPIYRNFEPRDLVPHLQAAGIDKTVLVQAADSDADTVAMLTQAEEHDWIGAVVGWVPLLDLAAARRALERYSRHPKFRGMRHLIHSEPDPDWVVRPDVIEGLRLLADFEIVYEVSASFPRHLKHVPALAEQIPNLTLVICHLAKPPLKENQLEAWGREIDAAARYPNVAAKLSGLNTAGDWERWTPADWQPYVERAFEAFGAERLMFGSDWPVCNLAGDYERVWAATQTVLAGRSAAEVEAVLGGTAARVYRL